MPHVVMAQAVVALAKRASDASVECPELDKSATLLRNSSREINRSHPTTTYTEPPSHNGISRALRPSPSPSTLAPAGPSPRGRHDGAVASSHWVHPAYRRCQVRLRQPGRAHRLGARRRPRADSDLAAWTQSCEYMYPHFKTSHLRLS